MKSTTLNNPALWLMAAIAALAIAAVGIHLDGPDDIQAAQDMADHTADLAVAHAQMVAHPDLMAELNAAEPGTDEFRAAAARLCTLARGDAAQLLMLADGTTVCRRAGAMDVAQGGAL